MTVIHKTEQEAIDAFVQHARDYGPVEFGGHNCEDIGKDCEGWDGESHRCECGNRRVCLLTYKADNGNWVAYAEAY